MDKIAKQALSYLTDDSINPNGCMTFSNFYKNYGEISKLSKPQMMACLRYLNEKGYIRYCHDQLGNTLRFELEHKAYHRFYFRWENIKMFLIKSVLVPIGVSIVTTIIALILKGLL
jgi:hypothetical protein